MVFVPLLVIFFTVVMEVILMTNEQFYLFCKMASLAIQYGWQVDFSNGCLILKFPGVSPDDFHG